MAPTSIAEYRERKELEAKLETSVARGVFGETLSSIESALAATGHDPVHAALWAIADLLDEAVDWTPQEIANAAAAVKAEVMHRNRKTGR